MSNWSVYMLRCSDGSIYTGIAKDLKKRVEMHNTGKGAKYTRSRLPVCLVWNEGAADRSSATKREMVLKKLTRQQKLQMITEWSLPL